MASSSYDVQRGQPHPLGATPVLGGVNFALFTEHATSVTLLLFDKHDDKRPIQEITLDARENRSFYIWHCVVLGLKAGAHYAYRVDGPRDTSTGNKFDPSKVLIDPYAKGNTDALWDRGAACRQGEDNIDKSMRSVVVDLQDYDWEGDRPINRPMRETIIYEMHVGGFTRHSSANVRHAGTFAGVIEKIPYLTELGVTAVELLPVFEFDDKEVLRVSDDGRTLTNYWGYSTIGFFAPDERYCTARGAGAHAREFRNMVKALHKAGIEVILDVVFNHTNEGNQQGPSISFKGIDNKVYYHTVKSNPYFYMDYSGCGNTVNCNHPLVQKFIVECLEFWVREMHVDGFRFDEGSILSRGADGVVMKYPPVIWSIELSETLAATKIIAEAWDAAGLYQVGYFPGKRWAEWNGRYRDDIRAFVAGHPGVVGAVARRIAGSADLYESGGRLPINSVNFVACHDGFTLNDLVSYNAKHNEANGEGNRDGNDDNTSWNCGVEGPSDDPEREAFRSRQIKNFTAILMLSEGVPMMLSGDEMRRTQGGNNNSYCQDNEISWLDWGKLEKHADVFRFFKKMIAFRKEHPTLQRRNFFTGQINPRGLRDISWHGCALNSPGWNDAQSRVLAFTLAGKDADEDVHIVLNMDSQNLDFELPTLATRDWYKVIDTAKPSPTDFADVGSEARCDGPKVSCVGRSVVVLVSRTRG